MNPWRRFRRLDRELDEELRAHLAMAAEDRVAGGETPADAKHNAVRELGNKLLIKEVTRDMWGWGWAERFAKDVQYALRQMARSPGFSAVAVATLALGLSATTVMFSIVNGVLLEPLAFRDPGRLYVARTIPPPRAHLAGDFPVNARHYYEWRTRCRACESVSLIQFQELTLVGGGEPVKLPAFGVSFNFFGTLGAEPFLGRDFLPEEDAPGHFGEVILSYAVWQSRFARDPAIIGRVLQLNGESHTVVGVMPPDLHLPKGAEWGGFFGPADAPALFRPLGLNPLRMRPAGNLNYTSVMRLKPGVSAEQAAAELNALLAQFKLETRTVLIPLQRQVTRGAVSALWLLLGTVGAVLLIVCVNVGNLMVVRTTSRHREAAVRMALGASRGQLFSLVLKEALVLVALGGLAGLALAHAGLQAFVAWAPTGVPRLEEIHIDWRVLLFAAGAVAFSTLACGLLPAWKLAGIGVQESLKAGGATSTESGGKLRGRELLVGLEVALSTVLLIAGGLLLLSFFRVMRVEKGFEVAHVLTQDVSFLSPKYAAGGRQRFVEEMVGKLARLPGVQAAAAINRLPLRGEDWVSELEDPDQPPRRVENAALANFRFVTPAYWQAMGIPLKLGRFLDERDKNLPRAVVSEHAARHLWPAQSPLGRHVLGVGAQSPRLEVVGVVGEVRARSLEQGPPMIVYEHYWRLQPVGMSLVVRTRADPAATARAMRRLLAAADPEMAIPQSTTMEQIVAESVATRRFQMSLAVAFAVAALLLAALGIYGVISFTVARRTPEMGIRIALGAGGGELMRMVLAQGLRPVLAGLAAGVAAALALGRLIAHQLFAVAPWDPLTLSSVAVLMLVAALAACLLPARRATRIDPLAALRFE